MKNDPASPHGVHLLEVSHMLKVRLPAEALDLRAAGHRLPGARAGVPEGHALGVPPVPPPATYLTRCQHFGKLCLVFGCGI